MDSGGSAGGPRTSIASKSGAPPHDSRSNHSCCGQAGPKTPGLALPDAAAAQAGQGHGQHATADVFDDSEVNIKKLSKHKFPDKKSWLYSTSPS